MNLQQSRTKRQREIIQKWKDNEKAGTVEAVTGFGKTYLAIMVLKEMAKDPFKNAYVVVPTEYLKQQWEERLEDAGISKKVDVWIINSVIQEFKLGHTFKCDILVLDEVHKYVAEQFGRVYDAFHYDSILGLTATIPEDDKRVSLIHKNAPVIDTVDMDEALENNWVSEFMIYNLGIELTKDERAEYKGITEKFNKHFSWLGHDFNLAKKVLSDDVACRQYAREIGKPFGFIRGQAANMMRRIRERKEFLQNLPSKMQLSEEICNFFNDRLIIVFSERTQFATDLSDHLGDIALAYHSKVDGQEIDGEYYGKDRMRDKHVEWFKDQDHPCRVLCTARALDQGADIPQIDMSVVASGSSKTLQSIQRAGRVIRKKEHPAIIVELYAKDTQDEKWLWKRQRKTPNSTIKYISSIEEIEI